MCLCGIMAAHWSLANGDRVRLEGEENIFREERSDGCSSATRNRETTVKKRKPQGNHRGSVCSLSITSLTSIVTSVWSPAATQVRLLYMFYFVNVMKMWGFIVSPVHCVCVCVCEEEISSPVKVTESLMTSWEDFVSSFVFKPEMPH